MLFSFLLCDCFLDASTTSFGTKGTFVLDKMLPSRHPVNEVPVKEVYERDRMTQLEQRVAILTQQFQVFLANHNQQNHYPYDSGNDSPGSDDFQEVDEEFEEEGHNYFESEPLFDTSDIDEDEDELDECEQPKNLKFCPDFGLSDVEVNNESTQEYLPKDVSIFVVKHVYRDPYLPNEDPSHKKVLRFFNIEFVDGGVILFGNINCQSSIKFTKLQRLECWKKIILHSYHLKLLHIQGQIFSILEGMMQGIKRTQTRGKVGSRGLGNSGKIYANQLNLCESRRIQSTGSLEAQRRSANCERRCTRFQP